MPTLNLVVTDGQWAQIQAAFEAAYPDETVNGAFMEAWIKRQVRAKVKQHRCQVRGATADVTAEADLTGESW